MTDYLGYGLAGFSFFIVAMIFYYVLKDQKQKFVTRADELEIAENAIASFEDITDKLIVSDILPVEAKNLLLFLGNLLIDEKEAKSFLKYIRENLRDNNQPEVSKTLYETLLLSTEGHPGVLDDFTDAVRVGMTAIMFKWPNQSRVFFEILRKSSAKTSVEVSTIEKYKNNTPVNPDKFKLATC